MKTNLVFKLFFFFVLLGITSIVAQKKNVSKITSENIRSREQIGVVKCLTVEYQKTLDEGNNKKTSEVDFENWMSTKVASTKENRTNLNYKVAQETYDIPVVVHIVHDGDEINTIGDVVGENISDAQVKSQIEVLNQDFRRIAGTPGGVNSTGVAVDTGINFVLARLDPNNLPTTGIIRHRIIPYNDNVVNTFGADWETVSDVQKMKKETQWDPTRYLNIWVIRTSREGKLDGVLGFAQFPSKSGLEGLNDVDWPAATDGVVISFNVFGSRLKNNGSFYISGSNYDKGRTTTHEVGHWLGLRHIWGDTDTCGNDDYCEDTPDATEEHYDCDVIYDTCFSDGENDMVQNYMDYTADACMDTFTQDQKNRMVTVLKNSPRRKELLSSPALKYSLFYTDNELEDFVIDPNPVSDIVTVSGFAEGTVKLTIYSINGEKVLSEGFISTNILFSQKINISYLKPGVYFFFIQNEDKKITKKIIKQ